MNLFTYHLVVFFLSFFNYGERDLEKHPEMLENHSLTNHVISEKSKVPEPIRYAIRSNKANVRVGEEVSLVVSVQYFNVSPNSLFTLAGDGIFLKVLFPEGFEQTAGTYVDFIESKVSSAHPYEEFTIKGFFTKVPTNGIFTLIKGNFYSRDFNKYIFKTTTELDVYDDLHPLSGDRVEIASASITQSLADNSCNYTNNQLLGTAHGWNVYVKVVGNCKYVSQTPGGEALALDWLYVIQQNGTWASGVTPLTAAQIPQCFTQPNETCPGCTPPSAPIVSASLASINAGQSSTLTASGCSGTVSWSNGSTGSSIVVSPGATTTYTATCNVNNCTSVASSGVTVSVVPPTSDRLLVSIGNISGQPGTKKRVTIANPYSGSRTYLWYIYTDAGVEYVGYGTNITSSNGVFDVDLASFNLSAGVTYRLYVGDTGDSGNSRHGYNTFTVATGCTPPSAPIVSASLASINAGQSSTLTASGCSGTVSWSNGSTGSSIVVSPGATTTYTATCNVNNCTSVASSGVTVSVVPPTSDRLLVSIGNISGQPGTKKRVTIANPYSGSRTYLWYIYTDAGVEYVGYGTNITSSNGVFDVDLASFNLSAGVTYRLYVGDTGDSGNSRHGYNTFTVATGCTPPNLSVSALVCNGANNYNVNFTVSSGVNVTTSAGTVSGNQIINIPVGTNITISASANGCSSQQTVTAPSCGQPGASTVSILPAEGIRAWSVRSGDEGGNVREGYRMKLKATQGTDGKIFLSDSLWNEYRAGNILYNDGNIGLYGSLGWWQSQDSGSGTWQGKKYWTINNEPVRDTPLQNVDITNYKGQAIQVRIFVNYDKNKTLFGMDNYNGSSYQLSVFMQTVIIK